MRERFFAFRFMIFRVM